MYNELLELATEWWAGPVEWSFIWSSETGTQLGPWVGSGDPTVTSLIRVTVGIKLSVRCTQ